MSHRTMRRSKSALTLDLSFPSPIEGNNEKRRYLGNQFYHGSKTHRAQMQGNGSSALQSNFWKPRTRTKITKLGTSASVDITDYAIHSERNASPRKSRCQSGYTKVKRFEDEHGNEIPRVSTKPLTSIYDDHEPMSARIIRPNMTVYQVQQNSMLNLSHGRHSSENHSTTGYSHVTKTKPLLRRTQSSFSRFSKLSQVSAIKESSDGMDNTCTDLSSEAEQEKDDNPASITIETRINREAIVKCRRWMDTLPNRFSGLCNVISLPDVSPGYVN